ncbi:UDP-N-acetylglucosamine/UDP-glucose/GDP-mannose transporter [Bombina bombina]|uniref:UDP-N-acetylglucosamine/UDP-glucose/GDP-mannose transporter n=1 Tax=Bombina bombina TaxID=8345 RepID=UPI00235A6B6B|nr:UDP-N-acetylglucosamine/UDP-glucose/GDP-mannose transporter [Bombina bombina]
MSSGTQPSRKARILSAVLYGVCSFLVVLVNKSVLTTYRFPSSTFLGIGQMVITIIILFVGKLYNIITFPDFNKQIPKKIFPLPLLYIGNHLTGLSSTQLLSLPMFTVLRKFSIPLTLIFEMIILRTRYSWSIVASVIAIILGALIAASFDLSFNLEAYIIVLLNDLFTALYGVYTKEKITKELGKYGVLYYNATFMIIPTFIYALWTGDIVKVIHFKEWTNIAFAFQFLLSCMMGFLLVFSIVQCSYYNSALATTVIGAIKNVCIGYIGIFIGGDYTFSWLNFLGLNICMAGGAAYSFISLWGNAQVVDHVKPKDPEKSETAKYLEEKDTSVEDSEKSNLLS